MPDDRTKKNKHNQLTKKIGLVVTGLFLFYVMVGFWVVPPLLKPKLEERLAGLLGRQVTIADITLNPLVLSATISQLTVHEIDGQPFAGFDTLYANAQIASIFKWALTVREIRVEEPFGVLKVLPGNKLNVEDILAKLTAPNTEPDAKAETGLPRAILESFQVIDGKAIVENLSGQAPIREELAPISFTIVDLSTLAGRQGEYQFRGLGPLGGQFEIDGNITVNPVRVQGRAAITNTRISHYWEHLKDLASFQVISGTMNISGEYAVEIVDGQFKARLENGAFELDDFKLVEKGKQDVLIALPAFSIKGIGADLRAREATIEHIQMVDGRIQSWLSTEGAFELQHLVLQDVEKLKQIKKSANDEPEQAPANPWQVAIHNLEVRNWGLAFADMTLAHPAKFSADNIDVVVENITNQKDTPATIDVSMRINQSGGVKIKGTAGVVPLQADLNVVAANIGLKSFQPYVDEAVNAQIDSGTISSTGRIRYGGTDSRPQVRYEGELSVDNLTIKDRIHTEDFITLAQLKTQGIGLKLRPNQLKVAKVLFDRPSARVTVDEAGVVNVVNAFNPAEKERMDRQRTDNLLKRLVDFLLLQFKGPMPMRVDRVELKGFNGDFLDASISPSYQTHIEITDATATGLSSNPTAKADFKFNGSIDRKGRLEGSGQMNPMNALKYSKANVTVKDFALSPVSPYSGKFIGYKIDQGTLNMDLKYQVANNTVDGNNIIIIDQLALGEPVDSPDALNLPIKLGVALLKDSEGRIRLQAPVKGNVKDPRFDIAKTIQSALTGTIEDAGSAPFSAITEVDGFTGEALSRVAFEFGLSDLQDREIQKLNALATVLKERKALILGILGTANRRMDGNAIMEEHPQAIPSGDDAASEDQTPADPVIDQVVENRLIALAQQRAEVVSVYLIQQAGIDAGRMNVLPVQIDNEPVDDKGGVTFSLSVE
jgi:hypothetical protein